MQVCHFFATTGCKFAAGCTKGSHDPSLVLPHLESIICHICVQHGKCTAKGCTKSHAPQVVQRYQQELAKRPPLAYAAKQRPAPAQHASTPSSLVLVPKPNPVQKMESSAIVTQLQGLGFKAHSGAKATEQVTVKQKRRKTNVVVALDVSGSMRGRKIDNAKKELNKLWHLLEKGDSLAIITFHSAVSVAMPRRFKCELKPGQVKRDTQFDQADLQAFVAAVTVGNGTALYDAVAAAMLMTQQAAEQDMLDHPHADWHTFQLLVITDGEDFNSKTHTAASVNDALRRPGAWAGKCHFSSCFVAIGAEAAGALAACTAGLKHSLTVADIDAGFRRLTETVAQVKSTTVQKVKKTGFSWGGGAVQGA
jgi:uncharacterized protein YegL